MLVANISFLDLQIDIRVMALTLTFSQVAERRKPSGIVEFSPHRTARAVPLPKVSAIALARSG